MKTKIIILVTLITFSFNFTLQAQNNDLFNKLSNNKNIASVYISKSMINMIPSDLISVQGSNMQNIINKLDQVEIYSSENESSKNFMKKEVNSMVNNKTYEILMNMRDDKDLITFYSIKNRVDKDKFKELIMVTSNDSDYTLIRMVGEFTADDIKNIINKQ